MNPQIPAGFVEVTQEEFYKRLSAAAAIDPMPVCTSPDFDIWEAQRGPRVTWGWSAPGWKNPQLPKIYAVRQS